MQRLQTNGAVPALPSDNAPLNLDGSAPVSPENMEASPVPLQNPQPGVDEVVTGPSSTQSADQQPLHPIIQGIQAGDPEAIAIINDLLQLIENQ